MLSKVRFHVHSVLFRVHIVNPFILASHSQYEPIHSVLPAHLPFLKGPPLPFFLLLPFCCSAWKQIHTICKLALTCGQMNAFSTDKAASWYNTHSSMDTHFSYQSRTNILPVLSIYLCTLCLCVCVCVCACVCACIEQFLWTWFCALQILQWYIIYYYNLPKNKGVLHQIYQFLKNPQKYAYFCWVCVLQPTMHIYL